MRAVGAAAGAPQRPADHGEILARSAQVGVTHLEEVSAAGWIEPQQQGVGECITGERRQKSGSAHT